MTVSHNTAKAARAMFPALAVMETKTPPLRYGRPPYWRAPVVPASAEVYVPTWEWNSPLDFPEAEAVTVLDVNAAYLAAMGSATIAHSELEREGRMAELPAARDVRPGYYKITVPYWAFSGTIVHPLGNGAPVQLDDAVWVAAPTLVLLLELEEDGHLGYFRILDSYTARNSTTFRSWSQRLGSIRGEYMDRVDLAHTDAARENARAQLSAFKEGYSAALSMMLTGEKCKTHRPDWTHTIHAQFASSTWRKAWRWTGCGRPVVGMGNVDEISVLSVDLPTVLSLPKPPFRFDETGRKPGALKPKAVTMTDQVREQRAEDVPLVEGGEDIL